MLQRKFLVDGTEFSNSSPKQLLPTTPAATFPSQFEFALMSDIARTVEIPALWHEDPRTPGQELLKSTIGNRLPSSGTSFLGRPMVNALCLKFYTTHYSFSTQGNEVWPRTS